MSSTTTTRRNRQTGTLITVTSAAAEGLDPATPWVTICEDHGGCIGHYTLREARDWAAEPAAWCDGCAEAHSLAG